MLRKFMIERAIPGVGQLDSCALAEAARNSNGALERVGPGIQWQQSYVTADRTYCVYFAESEELIRKHAEESGFPASKIVEIKDVIDPVTALR
jgi:hypothetical protein